MRGTLLNTATVAVGAGIGLMIHQSVRPEYMGVALHGLGLVTVGFGIKMFFQARNPLIVAFSVAAGGILGLALGIHGGIEALAEWSKTHFGAGGESTFAQGMISSFVLFCVGPMTLLGCLQDALERKIDLLALKSTMDGIAAIFLAAASGAGVLLTSALVLIFQGALTLLARPLRPLAKDDEALAETTGAGGAILVGTGLGLLEIKDVHLANYLPAVFLAPLLVLIARKLPKKEAVA